MPDSSAPAKTEHAFHIQSLDGIRAISIAFVYLSHGALHGMIPGGLGVTIFFFLSGYLITTLLRLEYDRFAKISLRQFYLRRVLRIFPPMYLSMAFAVGMAWCFWAPKIHWDSLFMSGIHLTNYYMGYGPYLNDTGTPGTDSLWSLAVEEHFYFFFPLLFIFMHNRGLQPKMQVKVMSVICLFMLSWRVYRCMHLDLTITQQLQRISLGSDTRMDSILFGCMLAILNNPAIDHDRYAGFSITKGYLWLILGVGLLTGAAFYSSGPFYLNRLPLIGQLPEHRLLYRESLRYTLQGIALFPIFITAIRFGKHFPWNFLNLRWIKHFGVLSYSFYLFHTPILFGFNTVFLPDRPILATCAAFIPSLLVSQLVYVFVEKPAARLRKKLSRVIAGNAENR